MLVFKFRQSSLFVWTPFSFKYSEKICHKKLFASLYIWIFSTASKIPPFVALLDPSSANSRILIYSNMMNRTSKKLATSCLSARVGQSHMQNNEAVRQTPLLCFTFLTASASLFSISLLPLGHILIPFSKSKGFFLSVWLTKGYYVELNCYSSSAFRFGLPSVFITIFILVPPQSLLCSFQAIS